MLNLKLEFNDCACHQARNATKQVNSGYNLMTATKERISTSVP